MVKRCSSNWTQMQNMMVRYPHLFTGLGAFPENYEIKLNRGGQPFAQFILRDVFLTPGKTAQVDLMRIKLFWVIS